MNRLMGPKGVFEEHERYKYLIEKGEYDNQNQQDQPKAIESGEAGDVSQRMLGQNNEYFYNDK